MNTAATTTATPATKRSKAMIIGGSVAGLAVIAGAATALVLAFSSPASAHAHTPATPPPAHHAVAPISPAHPVAPNNTPVSPAHPSNPSVPALPAAQVEQLQRELGQLNYYEGPINGQMTPQTVQAIEYLQRDAQLPQNGLYNQVTYLALQHFLAAGNNQMGD
jgi:Putative peptidoglycan binding domain